MNPELFVKLVKLPPLFHSLPVKTDTRGLIYCSPKPLSSSPPPAPLLQQSSSPGFSSLLRHQSLVRAGSNLHRVLGAFLKRGLQNWVPPNPRGGGGQGWGLQLPVSRDLSFILCSAAHTSLEGSENVPPSCLPPQGTFQQDRPCPKANPESSPPTASKWSATERFR